MAPSEKSWFIGICSYVAHSGFGIIYQQPYPPKYQHQYQY